MATAATAKKQDSLSLVIVLTLIVLDVFVWQRVIFARPPSEPQMYFLDVGQGDSELLVLPGGVSFLTDAGPDAKISRELEGKLPLGRRYLDLAIISHPHLDHFGGFNNLLDRYEFGAFIINGRGPDATDAEAWKLLMQKIRMENIPLITLEAGDGIRFEDNRLDFISPNPIVLGSADLNDTGLVELIKTASFRALLPADIGLAVENYLISNFNIKADILKIGHHGSKYSSGDEFLKAVNPKIAIIELGSQNRYGYPAKEAITRLLSSAIAKVFRTDENGTIKVVAEGGKLRGFIEKTSNY
jgi:beta-lactamase superfamily II metal-dependent hydrolase